MSKPFKLYRMNALIACSRNSCIALTALVLTLQVNTGHAESGDVNTMDIQEQKAEDARPSVMSPPPSPSAMPPQGSGEMMRMPQDEQSTRQKKQKPVAGGVVIRKDATDERGAD